MSKILNKPVQKSEPPGSRSLGNLPGYYLPYTRVGYGYVPYQEYGELYSVEEALWHGTLFPILDIPWGEYVPQIPVAREAK